MCSRRSWNGWGVLAGVGKPFPHTRGGEPMGRKINLERMSDVLETIRANDGKLRANDIARKLALHPQQVARCLTSLEMLYENDKGFLGVFDNLMV